LVISHKKPDLRSERRDSAMRVAWKRDLKSIPNAGRGGNVARPATIEKSEIMCWTYAFNCAI